MLVNIMRDEISITEKIQLLSKKSVNLEKFSTFDDSIKKNHAFPRLVTKTNKQSNTCRPRIGRRETFWKQN